MADKAASPEGSTQTPDDVLADRLFGGTMSETNSFFKQEPKEEGSESAAASEALREETAAQGLDQEPVDLAAMGLDAEDPINKEFAELASNAEAAEKLQDLHQRANQQQWDQLSEQWAQEVNNTFDLNDLALAKGVYQEFASDELNDLVEGTGLGNFPPLLRFLADVGKAMKGNR